ncbi:hypothetical protein JGU66_01680 [Myxococcaceae bacterium JPH2]|nr:hypothetical protein [Myxococcaceae bacterium JPH2]
MAHSPLCSSCVAVLTALVLLPLASASAAKIPLGDDANLNVGVLIQPQLQLTKDGAPVGHVGTDFFLRRVRLIVGGSLTKKLSFFVETEQPNFGKNGDWNPAFFIQDAFVSYEFTEKVWVDTGFFLVPLAHHTVQGAASLNTLDLHADLIRYPPTAGKALRDAGVQVRGLVGPLSFRAAILQGVEGAVLDSGQTVNPDDLPRVVGMARWNFLGREEDMFLKGIYFAKAPLVSVGVGTDYQFASVATASGVHDALALAADVFVDVPWSEQDELIFQTDVLSWQQGFDNPRSGTGFFAELGWRHGIVEPLFSAEYFASRVDARDLLALRPGFNLWFNQHTFNLKTEVAVSWQGDISQARTGIAGTAQLQLYY